MASIWAPVSLSLSCACALNPNFGSASSGSTNVSLGHFGQPCVRDAITKFQSFRTRVMSQNQSEAFQRESCSLAETSAGASESGYGRLQGTSPDVVEEAVAPADHQRDHSSAALPRRGMLALAVAASAAVSQADTFAQTISEKTAGLTLSSLGALSPQSLLKSSTGLLPAVTSGSTIQLSILGKCGLGVSVYPDFVYDPRGGGGQGTVEDSGDGRVAVRFDPSTINIPAVEGNTTTLLGVPLPAPIRIDIVPTELAGFIDRLTGEVELKFLAKFFFSTGPFYKAPPLLVDTTLTTEFSQGVMRSAQGERMGPDGKCRLVGTARVPPVNDAFLTNFLMLPTDVLAELPAQFQIFPPKAAADVGSLGDTALQTVALQNGQFDLYHKLMV